MATRRAPLLKIFLCQISVFCMVLGSSPGDADAEEPVQSYSYGLYGTPGLIDMPTAQSAQDAELAGSFGHFAGTTRSTLSFQIAPRLSGSFRYSRIERWSSSTGGDLFDRSFDLRYRLVDEGAFRPAIAVGLQDIIGTGVYSGEYLVATKHVMPGLELTGGLGWGRFGSFGGMQNPLVFINDGFANRPDGFTGTGGQLEAARWFRGDVAFFGGIAWRATDRLSLLAEYSSDAYERETAIGRDLFDRSSPMNFGLSYAASDAAFLQAYYLYGSEVGVSVNFTLNPKEPTVYGGVGPRPTPVMWRAPGAARDLGWIQQSDAADILQDNVARFLAFEGMTLEAIKIAPRSTTVLFRNDTYLAGSEAIGRVARILTRLMPASVETFIIVPTIGGVRASTVRINRSDLEQLEFMVDNSRISYARAEIEDATRLSEGVIYNDDLYPRFQWGLGPYLSTSFFDPDRPIRAEIGAELAASYDVAPGLTLGGVLRQPLVGNLAQGRESNSVIQHVRTDWPLYAAAGDPAITRLTAAYQFNLAPGYFGRVTSGYLESMYGGVSTELLWKPVDSRLGLGVELNYARQRDFDQLFGFQDYDVITGHASAYYAFSNNFHGQIDVGRYLAGDYGATVSLDREFDNGWRVGAFATFTDVPFEDFGEGSFDKGLRFSIPLRHLLGTPTRKVARSTLRPLTRDGGARLDVDGRLYETVRSYHDNDLSGNWGRFWR